MELLFTLKYVLFCLTGLFFSCLYLTGIEILLSHFKILILQRTKAQESCAALGESQGMCSLGSVLAVFLLL